MSMNANLPVSPLPGRACARLAAPALLAFLLTGACLRAEPAAQAAPAQADRMAWFRDAKLGIFIHWGIYSKGVGSESWAFHDGDTTYGDYMAQASSFTASNYRPDEWARLFKEAGARYAVLTSKHHDGFALWDTKLSKLNAKDGSPAGRDLVTPYCEALRKEGLRVGLYFSNLDWSNPDYASILPTGANRSDPAYRNRFGYPQGAENPEAWKRFLAFHRGQLREISERFKPDLLWFDGDWERTDEQWQFKELRQQLLQWNPNGIVNGRIGQYGDYQTPEQYMPLVAPQSPWELCATVNDSWGYQIKDRNFKSVRQCVRMLAECAGMGGNLLLDIGPRSDGSIPDEDVAVLRGLGRWTHKHAEALYGSVAGIPAGYFYGATTLSKGRDTLYLICFDRPNGQVAVKGIMNDVLRTSVVGGPVLASRKIGGAPWLNMPGVLWIDVPESALDPDATVIKVELKGPLILATGPVRKA
ncbi:MAG: alpha-L-fucosidase [Opitutaceae bacterium]